MCIHIGLRHFKSIYWYISPAKIRFFETTQFRFQIINHSLNLSGYSTIISKPFVVIFMTHVMLDLFCPSEEYIGLSCGRRMFRRPFWVLCYNFRRNLSVFHM
jgi:hypothetical protein